MTALVPTPSVSVVICVYTEARWDDLVAAVASVRAQTPAPEEVVMVVDHNEKLLARVRAEIPEVIGVPNDGRRGLSDARNRGVRESTGDIVVFLDDDARAEAGWLATLLECYDSSSVVGAGGAALPDWRGGSRPRWFPGEFDWVVGCSYRGLPTGRAEIRNFLGCNMSFRREAFVRAGGFDTSVGRVGTKPVGGEETEFCIRVRRTMPNARLVYEPAALVHHAVPASRATWRYFVGRCWSEGMSKAIVSRLAGRSQGLASERRHAAVTLPLGALRHLGHVVARRDPAGAFRAGAIVMGLGVTTAGYVAGAVLGRLRVRGPADSPA